MKSGEFEHIPLIDESQWSILLDAGDDDPRGLLEELRELFREDVEARLVALIGADPVKGGATIGAHAHSLAGSASNLSAARFAAVARYVEDSGPLSQEGFDAFVGVLQSTYKDSLEALDSRIANLD